MRPTGSDVVEKRDRRFDVVFFDLYGTLVDIRTDESADGPWEYLSRFIAGHGGRVMSPDSIRVRFADALGRAVAGMGGDDPERHRYPEPDVLPIYADLLRTEGVDESDGIGGLAAEVAWGFRRCSTSRLRVYPGAVGFLTRLRATGIRAVLVSNAQAAYTRPELKLLGLDAVLDRIVISSEQGVRKPDPELFRRALRAEGADSSRVVMVGNDESSDIRGSAAAGVAGVYLRTEISPQDDPAASPDALLSLHGADYAALEDFLLR
ncbi:HAD family hydrolase [uncultured Bifidobacterium sp.]|uniref:HAD family hydrolase n=1 Tax=uncultured Bifidobacterium sp. TaxID=165187 RepID=UPI0028DC80AD|nr:HAD family hydrolase [uncultured Bifidobacterium sp.]